MIKYAPYSLASLQHELIMSIDTFSDTEEIIRKFSLKAIKTLNLKRIHIIQNENIGLDITDQIFSLPPSTSEFLENAINLSKSRKWVTPIETIFIEEIQFENGYLYCFSIKDIGFIILERRVKPFDDSLIQALIAPISRFAEAYVNRKQFLLNIKQKETIENISTALELDKLKFETILGGISDSVIAINLNKKIIFANKSAHKFLNTDIYNERFDKKYYQYLRLFCLDTNKDITRYLESKAIKETKWTNDEPVLLKANGLDPIICEINVQEIRDRRKKYNPLDAYFVVTFHDITEAHKMKQELAWQASHDPLTGCLNRAGFDEQLHNVLESNDSEHHAFVCLDLDRFKHVNDTGGHQAGDNLLKNVSGLIEQELGKDDTLGRVGGDEFCILALNCTVEYANDLSERVLEAIKRLRFHYEGNIFSIGVSIGLTEIRPQDKDATIIFFRADEACMRSKQNGRNQVTKAHAFDDEEHNSAEEINYINYINKSLSEEVSSFNFVLYQQHIQSISIKEKDHIEILLRMNHEDKIILPNAFLPSAERYGMASKIDYWVVRSALEYISTNNRLDVNVNLSGVTLSDTAAMNDLTALFLQFPTESKSLCVEITETALVTNLSKCLSFMEKATILGVTFALDDFGTGLSNFGNLKNLPVKYLKIDGSFIQDICNNKIDEILVKSISEAASAMQIKTVAEYVENQFILDKISSIGIDFAQGYHLNRPEELQLL